MVQGSTVALASLTIVALITASAFGVLYSGTSGQVSSQQQSVSTLQAEISNADAQISSLRESTVTTTATITQSTITTTTSTTTSLVTTTTTLFPPTNSSYALTYIDGNATITEPSCGSYVVAVDVTYEMHSQIYSSSLIQWARFPSNQVMQPNTQKVFTNQADVTVASTYDYSTGACEVGIIQSLVAFVTDNNNNQLSPSTSFVVLYQ